ncbi:hypothetical protein KCU65_g7952, partial [Aureobasidium melanogenum]
MATAVTEPLDNGNIAGDLKIVIEEAVRELTQYIKQEVADLEAGLTNKHADQDEIPAVTLRGQRKQDFKRLLDNTTRKVIELTGKLPISNTTFYDCMSVIRVILLNLERAEQSLMNGWRAVMGGWSHSMGASQSLDQRAVFEIEASTHSALSLCASAQHDLDRVCTMLSEKQTTDPSMDLNEEELW